MANESYSVGRKSLRMHRTTVAENFRKLNNWMIHFGISDSTWECLVFRRGGCGGGRSLSWKIFREVEFLPPSSGRGRLRRRRLHSAFDTIQLWRQRRRHLLLGRIFKQTGPSGIHSSRWARKVSLRHVRLLLPADCLNLFFDCRTNVLERYFNKDLTITLPDKKKITEIKWFAIYDLSSQVCKFFDLHLTHAADLFTPLPTVAEHVRWCLHPGGIRAPRRAEDLRALFQVQGRQIWVRGSPGFQVHPSPGVLLRWQWK